MPLDRLKFYSFPSSENPLLGTPTRPQFDYICSYLIGLGVSSVIEEVEYFDRDYLSEFSSFYAASSHLRKSTCRRLHFFSRDIGQPELDVALRGNLAAQKQIERYYLGFCVVRPLEGTPLGKTVLKWYEEDRPATPRITEPSRPYTIHLVGIPLSVRGLAWQQQDGGVSLCATIALWTMLHSSAFFEYYSVPTTAQITTLAHKRASFGSRVFPSEGLNVIQICDAIDALGLAPVSISGNIEPTGKSLFSKQRFNGYLSCLIRSGYPVLLGGLLRMGANSEPHAVCAVGFRDAAPTIPAAGVVNYQDENIEFAYIHDDNIGPSARFRVSLESNFTSPGNDYVVLERSSPRPNPNAALAPYGDFIPRNMVAAVHEEMRLQIDRLFITGERIASRLLDVDEVLNGTNTIGLTVTFRVIKCFEYMEKELTNILSSRVRHISRVKLELFDKSPPMGLHIGIVRIGDGLKPLMDLLVDVTDSPHNSRIIAHIVWDPSVKPILDNYVAVPNISINDYAPNLGLQVLAY